MIEDVTPPNYTLHKPTNNVINKDISAYKIMEMVSDKAESSLTYAGHGRTYGYFRLHYLRTKVTK